MNVGKCLYDKVGVKGMQWIGRALAVVVTCCAGYACYLVGKGDGSVETCALVEKELNDM